MNDLVGLRYGWGHRPGDGSGLTDCFQLVCEVRDRLGLSDYRDRFAWVYERYTEQDFPRQLLARWLLKHGSRLNRSWHGAVVLLPAAAGGALGICVEDRALFIGAGQNVVQAPVPARIGHFFWMVR
jgi:hypothetical protein